MTFLYLLSAPQAGHKAGEQEDRNLEIHALVG